MAPTILGVGSLLVTYHNGSRAAASELATHHFYNTLLGAAICPNLDEPM